MAENLITLRNKKTGEVVQVPRSQYVSADEDKGLEGIGNDFTSSLLSAPAALGKMIGSIPGGIKKTARYAATNNPLSTFANLGAGGVESAAGLLSAPQVLIRYLADKFPEFGKRIEKGDVSTGGASYKSPTPFEALNDFEKNHGLAPQSEDEASVRNAGGLVFGGKTLSALPNLLTRTGTIAAQQAGQGGDPVHAAILGMLGEKATQLPYGKVKSIPAAAMNAAKNIPEMAGKTAASGLESIADLTSQIPGVGKLAAPIVQPTVGALASYLKHKSVAPEELAKRNLFGDITSEDLPTINERLEAAKRLGISFLTPGEAVLSPFQTAKEANIGRTSSGAKLLYEKGKQRIGTEGQAINNLLDTIYDDTALAPDKKAAYEQTMSQTLPKEFIDKHSDDPVIAHAMEQLHKDPIYQKALGITKKTAEEGISPQNTFEYWDQVKRVLGDMEESNDSGQGRKPFKKSVIADARRNMVSEMDEIEPQYKLARNISERQFTRKKLEDVFDKKSMTLNNFWSFLKSDKAFDKVMQKLEPFPEAQQKLKDIRLLSNEMIPFDESIRSSYKLEKTGMTKDRNKLDALKRDLDQRFGQEHDVAAVKLMTDPNWQKTLMQYLTKKGK
ncbi:MAG TPA: hypothetical protein VJ279_08430 [Hanamia sp.]|jgi:hypothetical protein|nr:hypothetical protein [Hanamia sp.]